MLPLLHSRDTLRCVSQYNKVSTAPSSHKLHKDLTYFDRELALDENVNSFSSHKSSSLSASSNCGMRSLHACSNSVAACDYKYNTLVVRRTSNCGMRSLHACSNSVAACDYKHRAISVRRTSPLTHVGG